MNRIPEFIVLAGIALACTCLYMGATDQIDTAEMIVTTCASLFIAIVAALESLTLS